MYSTSNTNLDNYTGAADYLPRLASVVNLAQTCPLAKFFVVVHSDQWDLVLITQGLDKLLVHGLIAVLRKNTKQGLPPIKHTFYHSIQQCDKII